MINFFKRKKQKKYRANNYQKFFFEATTSNLINKFFVCETSIDDVIDAQLSRLVQLSRNEANNNIYVNSFLNLAISNVIGEKGFKISVKTKNQDLNNRIEKNFKKWCKKCDLLDQNSFKDFCNLALISFIRDGEFFFLKKIEKGTLKLLALDTTKFDPSFKQNLNEKNKVINAVETNSIGKVSGYFFIADKYSKKYTKIKKNKIIHGFKQNYINQKRGIPLIATALIKLNLIKEFEQSAVDNAKMSAKIVGMIKKNEQYQMQEEDYNEDTVIERIKQNQAEILELPVGREFQAIDSQYPNSEFGNFKKAVLQGISGGIGYGCSYPTLSGDLEGVSYSSIRQGKLQENDSWKILQSFIIEKFILKVFETWLELENFKKEIYENEIDEILENVHFQGRRWAWVDPVKDARAIAELLKNNITSLSQVIRERGEDPDDIFLEIKKDNEKLKEYGIFLNENNKENE